MSDTIITGKILSFDTYDLQGDIVPSDCVVDFSPEMILVVETEKGSAEPPIGIARLKKKADGIWAEMRIDRDYPYIKGLIPFVNGKVLKKDILPVMNSVSSERNPKPVDVKLLKHISVTFIGLTTKQSDPTIKTLEEMKNESGTETKD